MKMGQQPTEPTHLTGVHFFNKWLKLCTYPFDRTKMDQCVSLDMARLHYTVAF